MIVWAKQALHLMNESHVTARFLGTTSAWQSAWLRFTESLRRERMLAREPWLSYASQLLACTAVSKHDKLTLPLRASVLSVSAEELLTRASSLCRANQDLWSAWRCSSFRRLALRPDPRLGLGRQLLLHFLGERAAVSCSLGAWASRIKEIKVHSKRWVFPPCGWQRCRGRPGTTCGTEQEQLKIMAEPLAVNQNAGHMLPSHSTSNSIA